jgi:methionine synthase I (cobalamin-dependent)
LKPDFLEFLKKRKVVIFDGGMGSLLIDAGMKADEIPELWNIEHRDVIKDIQKGYFEAGADVILTNTFGGSGLKLMSKGFEDRVEEINNAAVSIAKSICPKDKYVAGDIGPTGLFLPPVGKCTEELYYKSFKNQAKALINSGVDLIVIETMYDLREATQAIRAVREINKGMPIIATMTFEKRKKGFFTIMGDTPNKAFKRLEEAGANVVGVNCTLNSNDMIELCKEVRNSTSLPLLFQPNAGQPEIVNENVVYPQTPTEFANDLKTLVTLGADMVGGCCGTTPEFIKKAYNTLME